MIPEREIEERLKAKFAAALGETAASLRTVGAWDVANDGEVKGRGDDSAAILAVSVGIRSYDSFCSPQADLNCALVLSVRRDACPTGAALADLIEPLLDLLHSWNADEEAVFSDLMTDHFSPAGFQLVTGGSPEYDPDSAAWTVTIDFALRGVIYTGGSDGV